MNTENKELHNKAKELVSKMTLEEKAGLCSGRDAWTTKPIDRLGLESIWMADGPHGLRKSTNGLDNVGIGDSIPSVCFPTASGIACSFDRELVYEVGEAIAEECLQEEVSIILGPGVNQKRSPLCGRNFEYYCEDPIVSGELGAAMIQGVQSKGVGTSLKHFAVNNQEKFRAKINAVVDERAFHEVYLKAFEIAVKKGKPWTLMCAYNKVNGTYCSDNSFLLTKILREGWGFEGAVMSDWGAVNDRTLGVEAGLDLEMPGSRGINDAKVVEAVKSGKLSDKALELTAIRNTELILKGLYNKKMGYRCDMEKHHELAIKAAEESAVLLKNDNHILPGNMKQKAAVIGAFAKFPRYQGSGSSRIHPYKLDTAWDTFVAMGCSFEYAAGYSLKEEDSLKAEVQEELIREACQIARDKDIVYIFAGLTEELESEGFDREVIDLPKEHNRLIEEVCKINPNVVVILSGGSPMALPWVNKVKGILLSYLGGEGSGAAAVRLLMGSSVPCGKLAETWPLQLGDVPSYHYFPGGNSAVEYRESIFVGYRYYEAANKPVLYPFGYGLSYTNFEYQNIRTDKKIYSAGEKVIVTIEVKNMGTVTAKETIFCFVSHQNDKVMMPVKELKEFVKVSLEPGEQKTVSITLDTKDLTYYNRKIHDWDMDPGEYTILAASSLVDCNLQEVINLESPKMEQPEDHIEFPSYVKLTNQELSIPDAEFTKLYGALLPPSSVTASRPYNETNTLMDVKNTFIGKMILKQGAKIIKKNANGNKAEERMMVAGILEMPMRTMVTMGGFPPAMLEGIILMLNGHYIKGIGKILNRNKNK